MPIAVMLAAAAVSAAPVPTEMGQDSDYIYCTGFDASAGSHYYSAVFRGDYLQNQDFARRFTAHLRARYSASLPASYCFYEPERREAETARDNHAAGKRAEGHRVILTYWVG